MLKKFLNTNNLVNQHLVLISLIYQYHVNLKPEEQNPAALQDTLLRFFLASDKSLAIPEQTTQDTLALLNLLAKKSLNNEEEAKAIALKKRYKHIHLFAFFLTCTPSQEKTFLFEVKPSAIRSMICFSY